MSFAPQKSNRISKTATQSKRNVGQSALKFHGFPLNLTMILDLNVMMNQYKYVIEI